ncbi:MAG TPA: glycoside hydrolase family 43 protein [Opitutaceae bacterium]|nr:glycoside hydrolase family 43 protein [Opitutaceae bacterium]
MKTLLATAFAAVALFPGALAAAEPVRFDWFEYTGRDDVFAAPLPAGHFRNPILAGFYPDPAICRVGEDYYLINSTFSYFPGIPVFHSRDLVHWTQLGNVIDRPSQMSFAGLRITRGLFAPTIKYHDGVFYVVCTLVDGGGNFLVTATNPAGPWSDPQWLPFDGIDPSLYFDDDGRAWMVNNGNPPDNKPLYDGHRAIWIQEFDVAKKQLVGPRSIVVNGGVDLSKKPVWIEGPHLFKKDGWYYICCAEGGTSVNHSQVILRSKTPTGPFVPWEKNPILTQRDLDGAAPQAVTATGHANLVEGPDGNWWAVFLACRPFQHGYQATGRETFLLPVQWTDDGWPLILPPGERVPYTVRAPQTAFASPAPVPLSGNFTWRDEFDFGAEQPAQLWLMARTPAEKWWSFTSPKGQLSLTPRADTLDGLGNPSFLGRRLQHAKFDVSTELTVPVEEGVAAGLALFQSEKQHYFFGVRRTAEGLEVFVDLANGGKPERFARAIIPVLDRLELRIKGDELSGGFAFREPDGEWRALVADADLKPITTNAAGGGIHFTGAVVGPHVRLER